MHRQVDKNRSCVTDRSKIQKLGDIRIEVTFRWHVKFLDFLKILTHPLYQLFNSGITLAYRGKYLLYKSMSIYLR